MKAECGNKMFINSGGGSYNQNGNKTGKWTECDTNYSENFPLIFMGSYSSGKRIGMWNSFYFESKIGEGEYGEGEIKQGHWVEVQYTWSHSPTMLLFKGQYKDGIKIGVWNTFLQSMKIGGGTYKNGVKIGSWEEPHENYSNEWRMIMQGLYLNGQRFGQWRYVYDDLFDMGQGCYDQNGQKYGQWIEPEKYRDFDKVTICGNYINNIRVGQWNYINNFGAIIGGGQYDEKGLKQGSWLMPNLTYNFQIKITSQGSYLDDKESGLWVFISEGKKIGGGQYEEGNKSGVWTDIEVSPSIYHDQILFFYEGEYKFGKKCGKWTIKLDGKEIGGGQYENGTKQGIWTDLHDNYHYEMPYTMRGMYKNDVKIGEWNIFYNEEMIGGGKYDENGVKQGFWRDIHEYYYKDQLFLGNYKNGIKIGQWKAQIKDDNEIICGVYDEDGNKQGFWKEVICVGNGFYCGEYKNGIRIGHWCYEYLGKNMYIHFYLRIAGKYDEMGIKQGLWNELYTTDRYYFLSTSDSKWKFKGEYKNGLKQGIWKYFDIETEKEQGCYGEFDSNGNEIKKQSN